MVKFRTANMVDNMCKGCGFNVADRAGFAQTLNQLGQITCSKSKLSLVVSSFLTADFTVFAQPISLIYRWLSLFCTVSTPTTATTNYYNSVNRKIF